MLEELGLPEEDEDDEEDEALTGFRRFQCFFTSLHLVTGSTNPAQDERPLLHRPLIV